MEDGSSSGAAVQRLRIRFGKDGPARYISHLDLARTLERSLNRAGMPVAYSQGFNRRPKMSLAAALPLGYTSEAELADIWLTEEMSPPDVVERLRAALAPGITVFEVSDVPLKDPSLQQQMAESTYTVSFLDAVHAGQLRQRVEAILSADELPRVRKRRNKEQVYDLRPLIYELAVTSLTGGETGLAMRLRQDATQTGRPDEVLLALGQDPLDARVHRVAIGLAGQAA